MNIDLLIKMVNEIGDFFAGTAEPPEATRAVANHLKRYWEPRMRAQMIAYYEQRQGAGLSDLARSAVALDPKSELGVSIANAKVLQHRALRMAASPTLRARCRRCCRGAEPRFRYPAGFYI